MINVENFNWEKVDGLILVIIQDVVMCQVFMLGYMNVEVVVLIQEIGKVYFYSCIKQCIWKKGEMFGNMFKLVQMVLDCDGDILLVEVCLKGFVCYIGIVMCFGDDFVLGLGFLVYLCVIIKKCCKEKLKNFYVGDLFVCVLKKFVQKVGEEGVEVVMVVVLESKLELVGEVVDLIFYLMVLLELWDLSFDDVVVVLCKCYVVCVQNKQINCNSVVCFCFCLWVVLLVWVVC